MKTVQFRRGPASPVVTRSVEDKHLQRFLLDVMGENCTIERIHPADTVFVERNLTMVVQKRIILLSEADLNAAAKAEIKTLEANGWEVTIMEDDNGSETTPG